MIKKLSRGTEVDTERCVQNVGGNKFDLILIAAARSREIARKHKDSESREHNYATVQALLDIQQGTIGREYLTKVK